MIKMTKTYTIDFLLSCMFQTHSMLLETNSHYRIELEYISDHPDGL